MVTYDYVNYGGSLHSDDDHIINVTINDDGTYWAVLPPGCQAGDGQEVTYNADVSVGWYKIQAWDAEETSTYDVCSTTTPRQIRLKYVDSVWTIISDTPMYLLQSFTSSLYALSGNPVLDNDGEQIDQSGVDVVGINTINVKAPLLSGDDITIGKVNGKYPALNGEDATFDDLSVNTLTVGTVQSASVQKYEVDNSAAGYFYNAIDTFYGLPVSDGEMVNVNIDAASFNSGVGRVYHINGIYKEDGAIWTLGYYITDYGNPTRIYQTVSETSTPLSDCGVIYFYV